MLSASHIVKRDRLVISSEKTCKNRGLLKLKNLVKDKAHNIRIELASQETSTNKVFFQDEESNHILLSEFSGSVWKAKCPTIMGQHYIDCFNKLRQRFSHLQKFIIIDWTEMLDYAKVTAGSQAAIKVFINEDLKHRNLEIYNIFFGDDKGEIYEIIQFMSPSLAGVL